MLDWITHIWTKPLASWTLLDMIGMAIGSIAGVVIILSIYAVFGMAHKNLSDTSNPERISLVLLMTLLIGALIAFLNH